MCALCGVIGGAEHWSDGARTLPGAPARTRGRERQDRVRLANAVLRHYGLSLSDWQGASFVLKSRTGRQAIVSHLSEMWAAAETMAHRPCDPLDPELIAALSERKGR